jgi:hypothetical protein
MPRVATATVPVRNTARKSPNSARLSVVARENMPAEGGADQQKVVRDGFTMPRSDYDKLKALKAVCLKRGVEVKKSELLRAGLQALEALPLDTLLERMRALPAIKSGRKKKKP